jgi:hypothetical protein
MCERSGYLNLKEARYFMELRESISEKAEV